MKILKALFKQLFCKHKDTILVEENTHLFGKDYLATRCVNCNKWIR